MLSDGFSLQSLTLDKAIDPHFLTVSPNLPLREVLAMMSQIRNSCSLSCLLADSQATNLEADLLNPESLTKLTQTLSACVLVMENKQIQGIFTQRDIVRLTTEQTPLADLSIGKVITQPTITLENNPQQNIFTALALFRQHRIRYLPIVNQDGQPTGIVTHQSIRHALQPINLLTRLHAVKDVMTSKVIHASPTTSIFRLAQLMTGHRVSCIVICAESNDSNGLKPLGLVTEGDIVQFLALELDLHATQAQTVMSSPLFSLYPEDSLWVAHQKMSQLRVQRIGVIGKTGELVGIVSQTSLLQVLSPSDMYSVIEMLQNAVDKHTLELEQRNTQLRHEIAERQRAENELQKAHDHLKDLVEARTAQLIETNEQLKEDISKRQEVENALRDSEAQLRKQANQLQVTLDQLQNAQIKLIQTEKMSSLGKMVAGIAHEINNPTNFIYGNITHATEYAQGILELLDSYQKYYARPPAEIRQKIEEFDLDFVRTDLVKLLESMKSGAERIRNLVLSLRNFSRLDEAQLKSVNIHEGIDSTLVILQNQLKSKGEDNAIKVIKDYGNLPLVECFPGQLNQVFLNLLSNAIDTLKDKKRKLCSVIEGSWRLPGISPENLSTHSPGIFTKDFTANSELLNFPDKFPQPTISIYTAYDKTNQQIIIRIADNGCGMDSELQQYVFDPFFTTKAVGSGSGLGLAISYQIVVDKHQGHIACYSSLGIGTEFTIQIPQQSLLSSSSTKIKSEIFVRN